MNEITSRCYYLSATKNMDNFNMDFKFHPTPASQGIWTK